VPWSPDLFLSEGGRKPPAVRAHGTITTRPRCRRPSILYYYFDYDLAVSRINEDTGHFLEGLQGCTARSGAVGYLPWGGKLLPISCVVAPRSN